MKAAQPSYRLELTLPMDEGTTRCGFASLDAACRGDWIFHIASLLRCLVVGSEHHQCMHGCSAPRVPVESEGSPSAGAGGLDGRGGEALCFTHGPADHQSNHLDEKLNRDGQLTGMTKTMAQMERLLATRKSWLGRILQ